nr:Meiotic nuclear division protein 1 [Polyrhizophydium stewartii]
MYRNPGTGSSSGLGSASGVGGSSGGGDREARLRQEQQERLLESGNDSLADSLHTKVSKIKSVTIQMHGDMEEDNRSLDDMGNSFDSVGNQIKRTVNKLQIVMSQPHTRQTFMIADMSKRTKPLSLDEKRKRMLEIFHDSRDFFNLKELEKIAPKSKGIIEKSVKEVVESLVNDGIVQTEKIGSSNYFWSFPGAEAHQIRKRLEATQAELSTQLEKKAQAVIAIAEASAERADSLGQDERRALLAALHQAEQEHVQLTAEIAKYKDSDPAVIAAKERGSKIAFDAATRWTDNLFTLQQYCRETCGMSGTEFNANFGIPENFDYPEPSLAVWVLTIFKPLAPVMDTTDVANWADRALILRHSADDYLTALHGFKQALALESSQAPDLLVRGGMLDMAFGYDGTPFTLDATARPAVDRIAIFADPAIAGLQKQVAKKFPDCGDIGKNLQSLQAGYADVAEATRPYFAALAATAEFMDKCVLVILSASRFSRLNMEMNPDLAAAFVDLLIALSSTAFLVGTLGPEAKLVAFAYNRAHQVQMGGIDAPGWASVSKLLCSYEKPAAALQEALSPIASRIITTVLSMRPDVEHRMAAPIDVLRSACALSPTAEVQGAQPAGMPHAHLAAMAGMPRIFKACVFAILIAPVEAFQQVASIDQLKIALQYGFQLPLYRNETMHVGPEFEIVAKANSRHSKIKSIVNDAISAGQAQAMQMHRDRRAFLRMQLKQSLSLLHNDVILESKFNIIAATAAFARDEILWYFAHFERDSKKKRESKTLDLNVLELIQLQTDPIMLSASGDFEAFRMNAVRFQSHSSLTGDVFQTLDFPNVIAAVSAACFATSWLDSFDTVLANLTSLKDLFFYQVVLLEHLKEAFSQRSETLRTVGSICALVSDFGENILPAWPLEANWISMHSICFATELLSVTGQFGGALAFDIATITCAVQSRTLPLETVAYLPKPSRAAADAKKKSPARKNVAEKPLIRPGLESTLKGMDAEIQNLERLRTVLRNILLGLAQRQTIQSTDAEFRPIEYFIDALSVRFRSHINQSVFRSEQSSKDTPQGPGGDDIMSFDVKRPSVLLHEIQAFMLVAAMIDELAGTDTVCALRNILMEQSDLEKARAATSGDSDTTGTWGKNKSSREKGKPPSVNTVQPFLVSYMQWYCEFVGSKALTGTTVYSPSRRAFCCIGASSVEAETFTDTHELDALCTLVGLQGMQFMDLKLTRQVTVLLGAVAEMVSQNQEHLERIAKFWNDEALMRETLRKMKQSDMREFVNKMITAGFILEFRGLMATALQRTMRTKFTRIHTLVGMTQMHYLPSAAADGGEFKLLDNMANQMGMRSRNDVTLRWSLSALTGQADSSQWALVPHLFAAALWFSVYDESNIYPLQSNAHCMLAAFSALADNIAVVSKRATSTTSQTMYLEFLQVSSSMMMYSAQRVPEKDWQPKAYDAIVLLLQRFAEQSAHFTADVTEAGLPSGIVQTSTTQLFHACVAHQQSLGLAPTTRTEEDAVF